MFTVEATEIVKTFGATRAVAGVSFSASPGEIFGLLGPNGAGKTTLIRILLDIFKPDSGRVAVLGGPMSEAKKNRIGYMPEERGLYQDSSLERCLIHLATLKGVPRTQARERLQSYLEQFDLAAHKDKKVKELSKGMQQKAQIISTIIHRPELIIIDEPFAGLDPVNAELVKQLIQTLREQGATIIMSTHQMHQVEALCNRILLINKGRPVLMGALDEIHRRFSGQDVLVRVAGGLPALPGTTVTVANGKATKLSLASGVTPQSVLQTLMAQGFAVEKFEIAVPTLNEIFIRVVSDAPPPAASDEAVAATHAGGNGHG